MDIKENKPSRFVIPILILLLNIILKSIFITDRDIALDEPFSIYYGQMNISSIIEMLYNENNPPLHFFILHFVIKYFGISALSVRLPSLIFSAFTAVFVYKIGEKFFNKTVAVGASLIFTFSTMHLFFSHEARVYPLFSLLTACSLYFFMLIVENPHKRNNFIALLFCNILLIYSHYFGFFVLFVEAISLIIISNRNVIWKKLFLVMTITAICYTPIILVFIHRLGVTTGQGTWVAAPGITEIYGNLNRFLNNRYNTGVLIVILFTAFLLCIKNKEFKKKFNDLAKNKYFRIVFIWFAIPYLIMFFVSFKFPMFIDRYILFTSIPFYISIAIAINHFFENLMFSRIALCFLIISQVFTIQLNPDNNRRLKEVAIITKALQTKNSTTIIAPDYAFMGFCYHYNIDYFKEGHNAIKALNKDKIFAISDIAIIKQVVDSKNPCIYIQAGTEFIDPQNQILKSIEKQYKNHRIFHIFEIYDIHYFTN